jgi:hypothetical protein
MVPLEIEFQNSTKSKIKENCMEVILKGDQIAANQPDRCAEIDGLFIIVPRLITIPRHSNKGMQTDQQTATRFADR